MSVVGVNLNESTRQCLWQARISAPSHLETLVTVSAEMNIRRAVVGASYASSGVIVLPIV